MFIFFHKSYQKRNRRFLFKCVAGSIYRTERKRMGELFGLLLGNKTIPRCDSFSINLSTIQALLIIFMCIVCHLCFLLAVLLKKERENKVCINVIDHLIRRSLTPRLLIKENQRRKDVGRVLF